ncbi:hypothetical protein LguiA_002575 [Lonicera macranthoides]
MGLPHPVFHMSLLKKKVGNAVVPEATLPHTDHLGQFLAEPVGILDRRLVCRGNHSQVQLLIQWFNMPPSAATWEDYEPFMQKNPQISIQSLRTRIC